MKVKTLKVITVLSLFIAGSLFAQEKFKSFYPSENNDSPSYIMEESMVQSRIYMEDELKIDLSNTEDDFSAFYPVEDNDSPIYVMEGMLDFDSLLPTASGGDMDNLKIKSNSMKTNFSEFYPIEDND